MARDINEMLQFIIESDERHWVSVSNYTYTESESTTLRDKNWDTQFWSKSKKSDFYACSDSKLSPFRTRLELMWVQTCANAHEKSKGQGI